MRLDLLLTKELMTVMPDTIKVIANYGEITVVFPDENDLITNTMIGENAVIEGEKDEIVKWLKPFDGIAIGCGVPQMESFTIMHIF